MARAAFFLVSYQQALLWSPPADHWVPLLALITSGISITPSKRA